MMQETRPDPFFILKKEDLNYLIFELKKTHRVIGPKIHNDVIVLSEIDFDDIPKGYKEQQTAGGYRLIKSDESIVFGFSQGFDSFKRFLNPPKFEVFSFKASKKGFSITTMLNQEKPLAFFAMRACDRAALRLYDRIFLEGVIRDPHYDLLRHDSIIIALNCLYPGDNCFCASTLTGPEVREGFDLLITELSETLLLESGSHVGERIISKLPCEPATDEDIAEKKLSIDRCRGMFKKKIRFNELPMLIYQNLEHQRWLEIAERDLECGNCTQVCPTCFCNSMYDSVLLSGISKKFTEISGKKIKVWDSCFSRNFARVHGGNFRLTRKARYRHWFAHKLAYTMEQFGLQGCVGCGRCITWCPVGIDITQELEALRIVR